MYNLILKIYKKSIRRFKGKYFCKIDKNNFIKTYQRYTNILYIMGIKEIILSAT